MPKLIFVFLILNLLFVGCQSDAEGETAVSPVTETPSPTPQIGVSFATRAAPTTAVIQTTPTPLPSPTATPTATPVVYQIESGDTILGIAIQRGTTVEEILALNPGIVPENLQIGQPVVLPPPPTPSALSFQGTPVPLRVTINKIHAYLTPVGSLWLLGEVTNEGETAVENIQVEIGLLAADGRVVGNANAWVATSIILPGERGPFGVLINDPPSDFAQPGVSVVGGQAVVELGSRYLDIALLQAEMALSDDSVSLSGTIRNEGAAPASQAQLTATFYDVQGNVTGFLQQVVAEQLGVGEERPFLLEAAPPGGETVTYTLHAEAQTISN
ncbi:MAG: LysM peptidoglycan-binding domain-containing protein [Anaerolineales bacterium]|nr:LysM peptidoglycan-binding domain-containing protein [Anaerolineales bacterium]